MTPCITTAVPSEPRPLDPDHKQWSPTSASGQTWQAVEIRSEYDPATLEAAISQATPSNVELLAWARRPQHAPPQAWWDDTTDPFAAAE